MTDETNLTGEKPAEAQSAEEQDKNTSPNPAEKEEAFDKERALETIKKLREIEKQYKKEKSELERLKADETKRKEAEQKRASDLEAELKRERSEKLRLKVAEKFQLPEALVARLQGETEEELEADAKALSELLPKQTEQKKTPKLNANDIGDGQRGKTDAERRAEIYGRGSNPFETQTVLNNGGGVFFVEKK